MSVQLEDLTDQRKRMEMQKVAYNDLSAQLDKERGRLQDMAEKLSATSRAVAIKSKEAEDVLHQKHQLELERQLIRNEQGEIMEQMQAMKHSKMDLARQRVFFLKEKVMLSRICT